MDRWTGLAVLLVLLPGLLAWWSGRRLVRRRNDPALAERLFERRTRLAQVSAVLIVALYFVVPDRVLLGALLLVAGLLIGSFPARKALFEETWGLGAYLRAVLRGVAAGLGFWILLAATPAIVGALPGFPWPVALGLAAGLFAWSERFPEAFLALLGAAPLDRSDLAARFAAVLQRAQADPPKLYRVGVPGGRWVNAFALPSTRSPAVAFSDTLLELLDPDEIAAVFAHEVAHLEYYHPRRLRRLRIVTALAVLFAALQMPLALGWLPDAAGMIAWGWLGLVLIALLVRLARQKTLESASDQRAAVLCSDPETLIRALTKIHIFNRIPRRWALDAEQHASHPSLARRIQAIRADAGTASGAPAPPTVLGSTTPGTLVILDADRGYWLEGVPADAPRDPGALREQARTYRSVAYVELVELRIRTGLAGQPSLVATGRTGRSWRVPLRPEDVGPAQAALDAIDVRLAPASALHRRPVLGTLAAAGVFFATLYSVHLSVVLLPALIGTFRPLPPALAALGVTAIAQAALALRSTGAAARVPFGLAALTAMAVFGALALGAAVLRVRAGQAHRRGDVAVTAGVLGIIAGVMLAGMVWAVTMGVTTIPPGAIEGAGLALLGAAAALATHPARPTRWAAAGATAGAAVVFGAGWAGFFPGAAPHPLMQGPRLDQADAAVNVLRRVDLGTFASSLRVSPGASHFAVRRHSRSEEASPRFRVGRFTGDFRDVAALDLAFLDDARVLAVVAAGHALELRVLAADTGAAGGWRGALPPLEDPRLRADPASGMWTVVGTDPESGEFVAVVGRVDSEASVVDRWRLTGAAGYGGLAYLSATRSAFAVKSRLTAMSFFPVWLVLGVPPIQQEVWRLEGDGERRLATAPALVQCLDPLPGDEALLCLAHDADRTVLWSAAASGDTVRVLGALPGLVRLGRRESQGHLGCVTATGGLLLVNLPARTATRISLPSASGHPVDLAFAGESLAVLSQGAEGARLTLYELR